MQKIISVKTQFLFKCIALLLFSALLVSLNVADAEIEPIEGVKVNGALTFIGQNAFGELEDTRSSAFGGKFDLGAQINGEKVGLWRGLFITTGFDVTFGNSVDSQTSDFILPTNTALALPDVDGDDSSYYFLVTQAFSRKTMITLGKFNMLKVVEKRFKLTSGGGATTFQNLGLALPVSGVASPYVMGVSFKTEIKGTGVSILVHDPRDAEEENALNDIFSDGVTANLSITVPYEINELPGFHTFNAVYSSQDGLEQANINYLELPPVVLRELQKQDDYRFFAYSFRQYLKKYDENQGWGLFGRIAFSDGGPNPIQSSFQVGVAGNSFIANRHQDTWGVGYFYYNFSDDLKDVLTVFNQPLLRDEQGVEAFYNYAISDNVSIGGNLQVIRPGFTASDTEAIASLKLRFTL